MGKKCINCKRVAIYNFEGLPHKFCSDHKDALMVNTVDKRCASKDCNIVNPCFNLVGCTKGKFCGKHKETDMINIQHTTKCVKCNKIPSFNFKGCVAKFCSEHKETNMINVKANNCAFENCNIEAGYNFVGRKGKFCKAHKEDDMINVSNKTCEYAGCRTRPNFNYINEKAKFCAKHKEDDMVDVNNKKCEKCEKIPYFNLSTETTARFCIKHKDEGMVDVMSKKCKFKDCKVTNPSFDIPTGKGSYCGKHKGKDMVNVIGKKCSEPNCITKASYGKPGITKSRCFKHRQSGMILRSNLKCIVCKKSSAIYGQNFNAKHCETHKIAGDINLVERECVSCNLIAILDANEKCEYCNPEQFKRISLSKQNALTDFLDANNFKGDSTDKMINGGECGKERPDRIFDFEDKIIILECDEHQHKDRQCLCEQTRMINIGQSFGGTPVYFIRWNPDNYSPLNDKKEKELLLKRYKLLLNLLKDIKNNKFKLSKSLVSAFYMYYDDWDGIKNEEWKILQSFEIDKN